MIRSRTWLLGTLIVRWSPLVDSGTTSWNVEYQTASVS